VFSTLAKRGRYRSLRIGYAKIIVSIDDDARRAKSIERLVPIVPPLSGSQFASTSHCLSPKFLPLSDVSLGACDPGCCKYRDLAGVERRSLRDDNPSRRNILTATADVLPPLPAIHSA